MRLFALFSDLFWVLVIGHWDLIGIWQLGAWDFFTVNARRMCHAPEGPERILLLASPPGLRRIERTGISRRQRMIKDFLVLGAGSAGLIAAMTLKRKLPTASVKVLRSPEIGVIGVGESTTPNVPSHLFDYLGISRRRFYEMAEPTWKNGIHFIWGPRESFDYTFEIQLDTRVPELPRPNGYYCQDDMSNLCLQNALVGQRKAFGRQPNGAPDIKGWTAFHLENVKLVAALEVFAKEMGVEIIDGKMSGAERGPAGIAAIHLEDGQKLTADFFIDASGFRSELLGKVLEEPFISFSNSLFNDRAVVGRWERTDEPILPYTTAETMDNGWCWRVEHEKQINRGYVYSSAAVSDDEARAEYVRKNPRAQVNDRVVKFRTGRYQRGWVDNVMAVGNACGFVEPLESTSLMVICWQCQTFVEFLEYVGVSPTVMSLYNRAWAATWDEICDFLALHFWANTRLDTPYWKHCRNDTDISRLKDLLEFYDQNGPSGFSRYHLAKTGSQFGIEGFLVMLVGCRVPYKNQYQPSQQEWHVVNRNRAIFKTKAQQGLDVKESLAWIRNPNWRWFAEK
jgi:tryptophan halogenase